MYSLDGVTGDGSIGGWGYMEYDRLGIHGVG